MTILGVIRQLGPSSLNRWRPRGDSNPGSHTFGDVPIALREAEIQLCVSVIRFQLDAVRLSNGRRPAVLFALRP